MGATGVSGCPAFRSSAALKGIRRRVVVFLGDRPFRTEDGIEALPVRDFLHDLEEKSI